MRTPPWSTPRGTPPSGRSSAVRSGPTRASGNEANVAKLTGAQVAWEAADQAFQTLGGMAYSKEYPVERWLRDARIGKNIPVAEQLVLAHIGTSMLGLPKSY